MVVGYDTTNEKKTYGNHWRNYRNEDSTKERKRKLVSTITAHLAAHEIQKDRHSSVAIYLFRQSRTLFTISQY